MIRALVRAIVLRLVTRIPVGSVTVVEGEVRRTYGTGAPAATFYVRSRRTFPMLLRGSRGLAESYAQGLWDSPDLVALIRLGARNMHLLDRIRESLRPVRAPAHHARALLQRNTRRRSRRASGCS